MRRLLRRPFQEFYEARLKHILSEKKRILDIGGALRIARDRSNRIDPAQTWISDMIQKNAITYKILDYVDTYHPDIVGDIQDLPLPDSSEEAIICVSILEHVENPFKAAAELYRVLSVGGYCFVYVPFLFYYHAEKGYYGDYWRFTEDSLRLLFKQFSSFEIQSARGPVETLIKLSPFGRTEFFCDLGYIVDVSSNKLTSRQTSGYYLLLTK